MAKRANGEGTKIVKVPDRDLYRARYTDARGKRRTVYGKTKGEVRQKLTEGLADRDKGLTYNGDTVSLQEHLDRWLESSVQGSVKPITNEAYERMCRLYIKPSIGKVKLSKLTPGQVQGFYQDKLNSGLAPSSVRYMHATLHRALKQAHRWRLVRENVAAATDPPIPQPEEIRPLTAEQVKVLLSEAHGERLEALFAVAVTAGLRVGELCAIQWSDLDMESNTLRVRRTLSRAKTGPRYTTPKNGKGRSIKLTNMATESLKRHRARQNPERLQAGANWQDDDLIFCREDGRPLSRDIVARSHLKPILKRADLPEDCTPHQLRHTCAALLLSRGVHPKFVQELLGHATIALTLDRYSHWIPSMGDQTATAMEAALS
jgi:integrase